MCRGWSRYYLHYLPLSSLPSLKRGQVPSHPPAYKGTSLPTVALAEVGPLPFPVIHLRLLPREVKQAPQPLREVFVF